MAGRSIEDVLGAIKVPVRSVSVCLDADLQGEWDELDERLGRLRRESISTMGDTAGLAELAQQVRDVEERMRASEVVFKFRGLSKSALQRLQDKYPPPDPNPRGLVWDVDKGAAELLSLSALQPTMSQQQAGDLLEVIDEGRAGRLVGAAWLASTGSTQVPFSARAFELSQENDSK